MSSAGSSRSRTSSRSCSAISRAAAIAQLGLRWRRRADRAPGPLRRRRRRRGRPGTRRDGPRPGSTRAAERAGFRRVEFAYEPVAAAHEYERGLDHDELVLIGDFGGGTSDFCLVQLGPGARRAGDRGETILGVDGVPLAGNAFDARMVRAVVSPALGLGTQAPLRGRPGAADSVVDLQPPRAVGGSVAAGRAGDARDAAPARASRRSSPSASPASSTSCATTSATRSIRRSSAPSSASRSDPAVDFTFDELPDRLDGTHRTAGLRILDRRRPGAHRRLRRPPVCSAAASCRPPSTASSSPAARRWSRACDRSSPTVSAPTASAAATS